MRPHSETCKGKVAYPNKTEADNVAYSLRRKGWRVRSYFCKACRKHHTGHAPIRKPKKVRR